MKPKRRVNKIKGMDMPRAKKKNRKRERKEKKKREIDRVREKYVINAQGHCQH